ncbi:ferritin-like domain-containing protein [Polyangium aurulentum]|uniref:ferritin-like domain-containing protein n=1 Tax=Polyangium aurulentum TaxID=2567896 RepID=UPI0010AE1277|nr:ferritin-like domain-containing protein [Polyangium aurulentum]UQA57667.1 ferritin-like domain-containing protein [Polyangium aurulentum]
MANHALKPGLVALGALAGMLVPGLAQAQENFAVSPGVLLSASFGDKPAFGLGLDVRSLVFLNGSGCGDRSPRGAVGLFGQAHWLNFTNAGRFAAGLQGGLTAPKDIFEGVVGEAGWTYRSTYDAEHPGGHGIHAGLAGMFYPIDSTPVGMDLAVRGTIPFLEQSKAEVTVSLGVRVPGIFGVPTWKCVIGRPLRIDGEQALAPVLASRAERRAMPLDEVTRNALGRAWLEDTQGECASIPAFLALARDLRAVGAPEALIDRALAAADDEARHTALCADLAGAHAGLSLSPILMPPPPSRDRNRAEALRRLALESWADGCLGEGAAAARARRSFAAASHAGARDALAVIARDEQRHADLGWDILAHCLAEGGRDVRETLAEAILASPSAPPEVAAGEFDAKCWRAHGRLEEGAVASTWEETEARARRRGEALVMAAG